MFEKTIRFGEHWRFFNLLLAAGFLNKEKTVVKSGGETVALAPLDLSLRLLKNILEKTGDPRDVAVMAVNVKAGKERHSWKFFDVYEDGITAMSRTTAFSGALTLDCLLSLKPGMTGIVPPEVLGFAECGRGEYRDFEFTTYGTEILKKLEALGIRIEVEIESH